MRMILKATERMPALWAVMLLLFTAEVMGQGAEQIFPLGENPQLRSASEQLARQGWPSSSGRSGDTLDLPFFDDFSEPFSRENFPHDLYPDPALWIGRSVYINDHMAVNPISVGVATFDGLDSSGLAYGFGFTVPTASDTLTSRPIDLSGTVDSVYLSFYYQAQGLGLAPAFNDRLTLEFRDTSGTWQQVWDATGYVLGDDAFRRAMIPITGEEYLYRGFQFQFVNYAALAGAVDHWHLDYVHLDDFRSFADTVYRDIAIVRGTDNLLDGYFSMPWPHFSAFETGFMANVRYFMLRNNFNESEAEVGYDFSVEDHAREAVFTVQTANVDVYANVFCSNEFENCADPNDPENFGSSLLEFRYPTDVSFSADSNVFFIVTEFGLTDDTLDVVPTNNIVIKKQRFYNYYAYDDGTAEVGYGLGNLQFPGSVAIKYDAVVRDDLRAIQYYLNPVAEDLSNEPVRFMVWKGDTLPEDLIYMSEQVNFQYSTGINFMNHFFLDEEIDLEGTFFIGWQQQPVSGQKFSIGFDRQNDASHKVFYNIGNTGWTQSSIPGAVMFRPVFGREYEWTIGMREQETGTFTAYPNPSTGMVFLNSSAPDRLADAAIAILDLSGREVMRQSGYIGGIDASGLRPGLYLLTVTDRLGHRSTQRIIISR